MTQAADLSDLTEDERIDNIGQAVMSGPKSSADKPRIVAFIVEDDAKADRYLAKLKERYPQIRLIDRNTFGGCSIMVRLAEPLR